MLKKIWDCSASPCGLSKETVYDVLITYGNATDKKALETVNSFEGAISVRVVRKGWRFFRYYSNPAFERGGRFLTRESFSDPVDCQEALNVRRHGNYCDLRQRVVVRAERALTFFGRVKGSHTRAFQWVAERLGDFTFHPGKSNWWVP